MANVTNAQHQALTALEYATAWLEYQLWYSRTPGAQLAVMVDEELVVQRAYGYANLEAEERMTSTHQFHVASHSKWFTATAVMRLVETGDLMLEDRLGDIVEELEGTHMGAVSLEQLLTHGSGVVRDTNDTAFWQPGNPFPTREQIIEAAKDGDIFRPGFGFKYSNVGFGLLGLVLERLTGKPYAEVLRETITRPLSLNRTVVDSDERKSAKPVTGYSGVVTDHARTPLPDTGTDGLQAAAGVISTASELCRFGLAHVRGNDELLKEPARASMQQARWVWRSPAGQELRYGLGTAITEIGGHSWIGHGGSFIGHQTRTLVQPNMRVVIAVATNCLDGAATTYATGVAKILLASLDRSAAPLQLGKRGAIPLGEGTTKPSRAAKRIDPERFTGRYASAWGVVDIVQLGEHLLAISPEEADPMAGASMLEVIDETTLRLPIEQGYAPSGELLHFQFDGRGKVTEITGAWTMTPAPALEPWHGIGRRRA